MDQLTIHEKFGPNYILLELSGAVNTYTISEFQSKVYGYILESNVVVDMSIVTSIDSAGIGVIFGAINDGEENGTKLFIMNPSEEARYSLGKTGFLDELRLIHAVTEVSDA